MIHNPELNYVSYHSMCISLTFKNYVTAQHITIMEATGGVKYNKIQHGIYAMTHNVSFVRSYFEKMVPFMRTNS